MSAINAYKLSFWVINIICLRIS